MTDVRVGFVAFDSTFPCIDVRVGAVEFNPTVPIAQQIDIRVSYVEFDSTALVTSESPRRNGGWRLHSTSGHAPVHIQTPEDFIEQLAAVRCHPGQPLPVAPPARVVSSRRRKANNWLLMETGARRPF